MSSVRFLTHCTFKKAQFDQVIEILLEAGGDPDHSARHIADEYPASYVHDYINIDQNELDSVILIKVSSDDTIPIPNALKKWLLSLKNYWKHWGDKTTKDWRVLTIDGFDDFLTNGTGPYSTVSPSGGYDDTTDGHATSTTPTPTPIDVVAITNAVSTAMLSKPPPSRNEVFLKNKGGSDDAKPFKEGKQWNTWNRSILSVAHTYDFKDITDSMYVPNSMDDNACALFESQQKHAFGILISSIKESSVLRVLCKYSEPNATYYRDAQMLYAELVAHFTQGLMGKQSLELIERVLDEF